MAKVQNEGSGAVYDAAERWRQEAWAREGSLFTPGSPVWTPLALDDAIEAIGDESKLNTGGFMDKLADQLAGRPPETTRVMAEALYVHLLPVRPIKPETKREAVARVLALQDRDVTLDLKLDEALASRLINPGQYYLTRRDLQLAFILRAARQWRDLDDSTRIETLADPWAFRAWLAAIDPSDGVRAQRHAITHLLFPDTFEPIVSEDHKRRIVRAFGGDGDSDEETLDRELLRLRTELVPQVGADFNWYRPPLRSRWHPSDEKLEQFLTWAKAIHDEPDFDQLERTYKIQAASAMSQALAAWRRNDDGWPQQLRRAFQNKENNLTNWQAHDVFTKWIVETPSRGDEVLSALLDRELPLSTRLDEFNSLLPSNTPAGSGNRLSIASFLLMAEDPTGMPFFKPTPFRSAWSLSGVEPPADDASLGSIYEAALDFCDLLIEEGGFRELALRDRLDAQSVIWAITRSDPPESWPDDRKQALLAWRGVVPGEPREPTPSGDEQARRRDRYALFRASWEADPVTPSRRATFEEEAAHYALSLPAVLDDLRAGDLTTFRELLERIRTVWNRTPVAAFWQRLLNQARVSAGGGGAVARQLAHILPAPDTDEGALRAMALLRELVDQLGPAGPFQPGGVGLAVSALWTYEAPDRYPAFFETAEATAKLLDWLGGPDDRHLRYWTTLRGLDEEAMVAAWSLSRASQTFSGLDRSLVDRCRENAEAITQFDRARAGYPDTHIEEQARVNARTLTGELRLAQRTLDDRIKSTLDVAKAALPSERYGAALGYRHDAWVGWRVENTETPVEVRLWLTVDGVGVGLWPVWTDNNAPKAVAERLTSVTLADELSYYEREASPGSYRFLPTTQAPTRSFMIGRWFDTQDALGRDDFADSIVNTIESLQPAIDVLGGPTTAPSPGPPPSADDDDAIDYIGSAADDLLIDREHLDEIVALLRDQGQVILYGPPGTGKTYLAQRLASALAHERSDRSQLVQFHPSTTYEDFFEGYRPTTHDGVLSYELRPGPLARMASLAEAQPQVDHILIVDEINRANLPKVFGELLYLLEYRDRPVRSLYRPDEEFRLPKNLLVIGTMNTADRSIGLIDAAMRRRFRFIPVFPDQPPWNGLLRSWFEANGQETWVADLVDEVNLELVEVLSRHLQLGPSFFMKTDLDEDALQRIWRHSIEPFIEDQLFGNQAEIDRFSWTEIRLRHLAAAEGEPADSLVPEPGTDGPGDV